MPITVVLGGQDRRFGCPTDRTGSWEMLPELSHIRETVPALRQRFGIPEVLVWL